MKFCTLLFSTLFVFNLAMTPSPGCSKQVPENVIIGNNTQLFLNSISAQFNESSQFYEVEREFWVFVPNEYYSPRPLVLSYHGWSTDVTAMVCCDGWNAIGEQSNVFVVRPRGFYDYVAPSDDYDYYIDPDNGWQTSSTGFNMKGQTDNSTCDPSLTDDVCHESCKELQGCTGCEFVTCMDDKTFTINLIEYMKNNFCIDQDKIYITGQSNGAMFGYTMIDDFPQYFADAAICSGLPMKGHLDLTSHDSNDYPPLLHVHGSEDTTIGFYEDQVGPGWYWYYELGPSVLARFAKIHECDDTTVPVVTPYDGYISRDYDWHDYYYDDQEWNFVCQEYENCKKPVRWCIFNGEHEFPMVEANLNWWFWTGEYTTVQGDVDCVGSWSECDTNTCEQTFNIVTVVESNGIECGHEQGETKQCDVIPQACAESKESRQASKTLKTIWIITFGCCGICLLAGVLKILCCYKGKNRNDYQEL